MSKWKSKERMRELGTLALGARTGRSGHEAAFRPTRLGNDQHQSIRLESWLEPFLAECCASSHITWNSLRNVTVDIVVRV